MVEDKLDEEPGVLNTLHIVMDLNIVIMGIIENCETYGVCNRKVNSLESNIDAFNALDHQYYLWSDLFTYFGRTTTVRKPFNDDSLRTDLL